MMLLTKEYKQQAELEILKESIEYFKSVQHYPASYYALVDRLNEITGAN